MHTVASASIPGVKPRTNVGNVGSYVMLSAAYYSEYYTIVYSYQLFQEEIQSQNYLHFEICCCVYV